MKTTVKQLLFAAPILFAILISSSSFKHAARNTMAHGSGIAAGIQFNFNAIEQKDGSVVGHVQYDGTFYAVRCIVWSDNSAILYAEDASGTRYAFKVTDNGDGKGSLTPDQISCPNTWFECGDLDATPFTPRDVTSGNIQLR